MTKDHVPSRQCFYDRVWPEGYEFPACDRCNAGARGVEQVVALYIHMANHNGRRPAKQFLDMIAGVRNNAPHYLPTTDISTNVKKKALRDLGYSLPEYTSAASAPIAQLPAENRQAFELFERRLTCALYYMHMSKVMPLSHFIRTHHVQAISAKAEELITTIAPMLPNRVETKRQKTDLGDQFSYIWHGDREKELFTFCAQFSMSFVIVGVACRAEDLEDYEGYKAHTTDLMMP